MLEGSNYLLIALEHIKMAFTDWDKLSQQKIFNKIETFPREIWTPKQWMQYQKNPETSFGIHVPMYHLKQQCEEVKVCLFLCLLLLLFVL